MIKKYSELIDISQNKSFTPITNETGEIVDYKDIVVKGYASTFVGTTLKDRCGDYILPGAFTETLKEFNKNPIVLQNHSNKTQDAVGRSIIHYEDVKGLYVEVKVSNAPGLKDLRFKIAEEILNTFSISGYFHYLEDNYGIHKVDLHEYSFVGIPMNQDALFSVRALKIEELQQVIKTAARNDLKKYGQSINDGKIVALADQSKASELIQKALVKLEPQKKQVDVLPVGLNVGGLKIT